MTNKLFQAYSNTFYKVFEPSLCIKIGEHNPTLDSLLEKYGENEYAYLTAYNPFSEQLAHAKNNQRHQQLKEDLTSYQCFEGEGCGEDPTWPCERSYLVLGISKAKAILLGNRYGQNAIVYGRRNGKPELVVLQKITDGPTYYSEVREERAQQWKESLRKSDDLTLIASFNEEVGNRGWGTARADYLHCLRGEIKRRDFDSSNVFTLDIYQDGIIHEGFSLRRKVKLENGKLVFIDNVGLGNQ